jgi:hypothetical protein
MPTLQTYTPKVATLPERTMEDLVDLDAITKDMPEKTKTAFDTAVNATKTELEGFDKPGFDTREGRLKQREAGLEKDSAIGRALNLMSLGFGIAGSKERSLAGALGNEGRQGIADLIRGEAANRAAKVAPRGPASAPPCRGQREPGLGHKADHHLRQPVALGA